MRFTSRHVWTESLSGPGVFAARAWGQVAVFWKPLFGFVQAEVEVGVTELEYVDHFVE